MNQKMTDVRFETSIRTVSMVVGLMIDTAMDAVVMMICVFHTNLVYPCIGDLL